jgi:hypothetical protein
VAEPGTVRRPVYRRHRTEPAALGSTNCVAFYRAELVRQRDLAGDSWGYLLPFVPGVTLSLRDAQDRPASQVIALAVFGVALFLGTAWLNAFTAQKRQMEIDALDASRRQPRRSRRVRRTRRKQFALRDLRSLRDLRGQV